MNKLGESFKKFWAFLKKDSWQSLLVSLIIAFIVIKFIFFPLLSLLTGTALPLVIVESCSMYHSIDLEDVLENKIYGEHGIDMEETEKWNFKSGLSKGDIIFVIRPTNLEIGDVLIFDANPDSTSPHPIIHRVISLDPLQTKGDHNPVQLTVSNNLHRVDETNINEDQLVGKAVMKLPFLGWIKLIFFESSRPVNERGLCD
jgi:hypothetical protein